jgi:hypothetical protein
MLSVLFSLLTHAQVWLELCARSRGTLAMSSIPHAQLSAFTTDTCAGLVEALSTDPCLLSCMRSFLLSLLTHAQVWLEPCAWSHGTELCLLSRRHGFLSLLLTHAQVWLKHWARIHVSYRACAAFCFLYWRKGRSGWSPVHSAAVMGHAS